MPLSCLRKLAYSIQPGMHRDRAQGGRDKTYTAGVPVAPNPLAGVIPALSKSTEVDDGGSTAGGTGVVFDWFGPVKYKEGPPSVLHLQDYWSWTERGNFGGIFSPSFSTSYTKTRGEILYGVLWVPSQCLAIASQATRLDLSVEITRLTLISFWHCTLLQRGRSVETGPALAWR